MRYDAAAGKEILARTPGVLRAALSGLPSAWLDAPERPGAWSPREVVSHMADLEGDAWIPRARWILEHGEALPLPEVARERFRTAFDGVGVEEVLEVFARRRAANLEELATLPLDAAALDRTGTHAVLGRVRLSQLLATWVGHDLTHLAQLQRALAAQLREAVGPWASFLSVLRDAPSGES